MSTKKLTKDVVTAAEKTGKQYRLMDADIRGLFLRVSATGGKSYGIRVRVGGGKQHEENIGSADVITLARAKEVAKSRLAEIEVNGVKEADSPKPTLTELWEAYQKAAQFKSYRERTQDQFEGNMDRLVLPKLGNVRVNEMTKAQISARLQTVFTENGPRTSTMVRGHLMKLWDYALEFDYVDYNLPKAIRPLARMGKKDRVLTIDEVRKLLALLYAPKPNYNADLVDVLKLLLILGQRRGEVANMTWLEIDWDSKRWDIPAERTKPGRAHVVPLPKMAMEILTRRKPEKLPTTKKNDFRVFDLREDAVTLACRRISRKPGVFVEPWSTHDLRRTVTTSLAGKPFRTPKEVLSALLNHSGNVGVMGVYNRHAYLDEKTEVLNAWSNHLSGFIA